MPCLDLSVVIDISRVPRSESLGKREPLLHRMFLPPWKNRELAPGHLNVARQRFEQWPNGLIGEGRWKKSTES